jgi:hypothetical protein
VRFVSQFTNYVIGIKPARKKFTEFGVEIVEEEISAAFDFNAWNQHDYETAVLAFKFRGIYQHEDEATPVSPAYRLSVFDTDEVALREGWDENKKILVEQEMLKAPANGRDYVLVTEIALTPPWPSYDLFEGKPQELVEQVLSLGYDLEDVIAYESSKWGQQREDVLVVLQAAVEARDTGEIIVT